ncbi:MAG: coproporphyrinogen dehydrogenase HemZ [Lachnospiraceae bacterium]|nr:coproporphyrinogen dehydrogenase HemZ [Lachnospiraceae bacterium]
MQVTLNSQGFSYDVHSLVKAFYPEEDVTITEEGDNGAVRIFITPDTIAGDDISGSVQISADGPAGPVERRDDFSHIARADVKNLVKRSLYFVLNELTGRELSWGTMTGIRPVKVCMKLIREKASDSDTAGYMKSVYLCSDKKTDLAINVAHTEKRILEDIRPGGFSLYVGIPFCPTTCMYCSFTSYPIAACSGMVEDYLDALKRELDFFADHYDCGPDSVYIGGGTPTTLSAGQLSDLVSYIRRSFDMSSCREFTVEAGRPDSITDEKLAALSDQGVSRISINPQTMNDKTLRLIGRRHTSDDVYAAFEKARRAHFTNINTDIILGLPGEGLDEVALTLDKIRTLAPESLTVHSMALKRAAAMHEFLKDHRELIVKDTDRLMDMAQETAAAMDLHPYYLYRQKNMAGNLENIGFAKEDCYGIYNVVIMEEVSDIAAAGAGTISKRVFGDGRIERCDNVKDVSLYIDRIDEMIERKKTLFNKGE